MQAYETTVRNQHRRLKEAGFTHGIFGDLFLEDLKRYRESLLAQDGLQCLFPLWKMDSHQLIQQFIHAGFKAIVVCVNGSLLDKTFCGRMLDESFLNDLPSGVDPCGENGEYHSFVFDGPIFRQPISFLKGEIVFKEYKAPSLQSDPDQQDDCITKPKQEVGFFFQDLIAS
ncbi:MAG: ATP-binding protein [Gammaproteobacteria bacterium]|nr:MAG: ATP-binding protein [Gammaproteobacteria bacterium]